MIKEKKVAISVEIFQADKEWLEENVKGFSMSPFIRNMVREHVEGKKTYLQKIREMEEMMIKVQDTDERMGRVEETMQSLCKEFDYVSPLFSDLMKERNKESFEKLKKPPGVE